MSDMHGDAFDERLRSSFALVAFAVNRHVLHHMARIRKELGMDFEAAFVLGTLAHLSIARGIHPGVRPREVLRDDGLLAAGPRPVRLAQLCEVTGLPRESVRRRLLQLQALEKVERTAQGAWIPTEHGVDEHTFEFTRDTVRNLLRTAAEVDGLMTPHGGFHPGSQVGIYPGS
jgi:hypothetical protein